jgi:hypothetical protein
MLGRVDMRALHLFRLGLTMLSGCDYAVHLGRECPGAGCSGTEPVALDAGQPAPAHAPSDAGDNATPAALSVAIQDARGNSVVSAQLECGTPCLEVAARAEGGSPPYSFTWDDGDTSSHRQLCSDISRNYQVLVHDSASAPPASASIHIERSVCSDAGMSTPPQRRCETYAVELAACSSLANADGVPQLRAAQPYHLRVRVPRSSGPATLQVAGMGANCIITETLADLMLPGGTIDEQLCLRPKLDTVALQLIALAGSAAELLTETSAASFELCEGCD